MATFSDFNVEVSDNIDSTPETFIGNVATAGVPVTITPTSGKPIQLALIDVPGVRDPVNINAVNDAIKYSIDGGVNYLVLMSGEHVFMPGTFTNLKLDTNVNTTYYRVIVWS